MTVIREMWEYSFMVNAFRAGTIVAVLAAVMGWFMVLRRQSFAGHSLAMVSFPGAAFATLLGISAVVGYFAFCVGAALVLAAVSRREAGQDAALTGTVQAFLLACGYLFVALYKGFLGGVNSLLFGSFLGITDAQVLTLAVIAAVALSVLVVIGRPLLFASVDEAVAAARGVPVQVVGMAFLVLVGACTAQATQAVGSLLLLGLLAAPAGAAHRLAQRPYRALALSAGLAVAEMWTGLGLSYAVPVLPPSFAILATATGVYALAVIAVRPRPGAAV